MTAPIAQNKTLSKAQAWNGRYYSSDANIPTAPTAPTLGTPSMTATTATITYTGGSNYTTLTPQYSSDGGINWTSIATVSASPIVFSALSSSTVYKFRALPDGYVAVSTGVVNGSTTASSSYATPLLFTPTININAEGGTVGSAYNSGGADQWDANTAKWSYIRDGSGGAPIFEGGKVFELNTNLITMPRPGDAAENYWGGFKYHPSHIGRGGVIHAQFSVFFPSDFNLMTGAGTKFFRICHITAADGTTNRGYVDLYIRGNGSKQLHYQNEVQDHVIWLNGAAPMYGSEGGTFKNTTAGTTGTVVTDPYWAAQTLVFGGWETFEARVVLDNVSKDDPSGLGMGEVWLWRRVAGVGMQLMLHVTNDKTLLASTDFMDRTLLFTYWNNANPPAEQRAFADRVVINTATSVAELDALLVETDAAGRKIIGGVSA